MAGILHGPPQPSKVRYELRDEVEEKDYIQHSTDKEGNFHPQLESSSKSKQSQKRKHNTEAKNSNV
jgi:hypothetical protein